MEVKKGYKQTEVGVIPQDWHAKCLKQLGNPVRGGSPRPAGDPKYFDGNYIPWLTVAGLTNIPESQLFVTETQSSLTEEGSLRSRTLDVGTLIIANSGATLGVAKILGVRCCANDGIAALLNLTSNVSARYVAHFINTKTRYLRDVVATGNGQPNLNTELIGNFRLPLPPTLAEQEAIATALSDADAWIESLEQLIAKKRQIKQGAMQELLTGKRRLPGFEVKRGYKQTEVGVIPEDWQLKRLRDISPSQSVGLVINPSTYFDEKGTIPILVGSQIKENRILWESAKRITVESNNRLPASRLSAGDLVMVRVGDPGVVSVVPHLDGCNCASMMIVRQHKSFNSLWLCYVMNSRGGRQQVEDVQYGTAQKQFNISDAINFQYAVPTLAEQEAIATTLSDMDTEIAMLETKLAKARQIKQGMMQELLTGRIRLI